MADDVAEVEAVANGLSAEELVWVLMWVAREDDYALGLIGTALDALSERRR